MATRPRTVFSMVVDTWLVVVMVMVMVIAVAVVDGRPHTHEHTAGAGLSNTRSLLDRGKTTLAAIVAKRELSWSRKEKRWRRDQDNHTETDAMEKFTQDRSKKPHIRHRTRMAGRRKGPFDNGFGLTPQEVIDYKKEEHTVSQTESHATSHGHDTSTDDEWDEQRGSVHARERKERWGQMDGGVEDDLATSDEDVDEYEKEITIFQLKTPHLVVKELREQEATQLNSSDPSATRRIRKHPPLPVPSEAEMECLLGYTKLFAKGSFGIHDGNAPPRPVECPVPTKKGAIGLLVHTDDYLQGALTVAHALTAGGMLDTERYDVLMMFTDLISEASLVPFKLLGCTVRRIGKIHNPHPVSLPRWKWNFSQIILWQQLDYEKIVYIDSDVLVLQPLNELFNLHEPAASLNYISIKESGFFDRHMLFNGGMMVLEPSLLTYYQILGYLHSWVGSPDHANGDSNGNQPFFNAFFKSRNSEVFEGGDEKWWYTPLNYAYNLNAMVPVQRPQAIIPEAVRDITLTTLEDLLRDVRILHFTRVKPWKVAGKERVRESVANLVRKDRFGGPAVFTYSKAILTDEINLYAEQLVGVASTIKKYCDSNDIDLKLEGYTEPYDGSTLDVVCSCYKEMEAIAVCLQEGGELYHAKCREVKTNPQPLWRKGYFPTTDTTPVKTRRRRRPHFH
eukprot:TRINITY_DN399_c0_g2_i1.p1 TRINITY_DN399_c0_g2~~TRINITY_DN399_c0_g2_i1.p1  ORF type:complete len:688 (+),score=83.78 TRINITY_DN399_c0_g2_i1:34-2064(+)